MFKRCPIHLLLRSARLSAAKNIPYFSNAHAFSYPGLLRMKRFAAVSSAAAVSGVAAGYAYAWYIDAFDPSTWEASGPPLVVRAYEGFSATGALLRALSASVQAQRSLATPQDEEALMFKAVVAGILADLSTNGTSERRKYMAEAGSGAVVDWLLRCLRRGGSSEQREAERALAAMFSDPQVAPALWTRPSVLPRVLQFMAQSGDTGPLGDAVIASLLSNASASAEHLRALGSVPERADVEMLVALAGGRHGARVRHVASWALAHWAQVSDPIRRLVAEAGAAQGLLRALEDSLGSYEHPYVRTYVVRGLSSLVSVTPPEMIVSWVGPLVGVWEGALASKDLATAALCMDALTLAIQAAEETHQRKDVASSILSATVSSHSGSRKATGRYLQSARQTAKQRQPPPTPPQGPALPDSSDPRVVQSRDPAAGSATSGTPSTSGGLGSPAAQGAASRSLDQFLASHPTVRSLLDTLDGFIPRARADTAISAIPSPSLAHLAPEGPINVIELLRRSAAAFAAASAASAPNASQVSQELRALQRSLCALVASLAASAPYQLSSQNLGPLIKAVSETFLPPPNQGPDAATVAASACLRELSNLPGAYGRAAELLWAAELLRFTARSRNENPESEDGYLGSSFLGKIWVRSQEVRGTSDAAKTRVTPGQEKVKANPASLAKALVTETLTASDTLLRHVATEGLRSGDLPLATSALDLALWRCLELLGDLALDHEDLLKDLGPCHLMALLQRIGPDNSRTSGPGTASAPGSEENVPHLLRRTCLRFLAILALQEPYASAVRSDLKLLRFIRNGVGSEDLRFASHARRALLHIDSKPGAGPDRRPAIWYPDGVHLLSPDSGNLTDASKVPPGQGWAFDLVFLHGLRGGAFVTWRVGPKDLQPPKDAEGGKDTSTAVTKDTATSDKPSTTGASSGPIPEDAQKNLEALGGAMALFGPDSSALPLTPPEDPSENLPAPPPLRSSHAYYTLRKDCWPSLWLAQDFPRARILSVEYAAPAVDSEGHVLPFDELGSRMLDKLVAAGVGQRPVVLVAHSLGGLLAKEMLLQGSHAPAGSGRAQFTEMTRGLAFFSVPHFGSWLADLGWRLKGGWAPSPHVAQLRAGPHLDELNDFLRTRHKQKKVEVLSFLETGRTPFLTITRGYALNVEIVPMESAFPGFGDLQVLDRDHINTCKPNARDDVGYARLHDFVDELEQKFDREGGAREGIPSSREEGAAQGLQGQLQGPGQAKQSASGSGSPAKGSDSSSESKRGQGS